MVRVALRVNPETAEVEADGSVSDPIPHILHGHPPAGQGHPRLRREARLHPQPDLLRSELASSAALVSAAGADRPPSARYQAAGCASLGFKPQLKLSLKGATKRAGHPALKAVVTYPKKGSDANIARAQVGLPHASFLDNGNLDKVCKQADLRAASCPKGSVYGHAKAWTPLLEKPLEGPVYLGVGYGHKLPDLVADLNGEVRILLHGKVDTDQARRAPQHLRSRPRRPGHQVHPRNEGRQEVRAALQLRKPLRQDPARQRPLRCSERAGRPAEPEDRQRLRRQAQAQEPPP